MSSWKTNVGKYLVTEAREIESDYLICASMSDVVSFGVFKILPYKEDYFPEVDYKIILDPIEERKYIKRPWYICDIESRMRKHCFNPNPKTMVFDNLEEATKYAEQINKTENA